MSSGTFNTPRTSRRNCEHGCLKESTSKNSPVCESQLLRFVWITSSHSACQCEGAGLTPPRKCDGVSGTSTLYFAHSRSLVPPRRWRPGTHDSSLREARGLAKRLSRWSWRSDSLSPESELRLSVSNHSSVGKWMREQVEARAGGPNLIVDSASRLLVRLADVNVPESPDEQFWSETVPQSPVLSGEIRVEIRRFAYDANVDVLIVDEAQDILGRPDTWHCLLALLRGGVEEGCFSLFGDVEHQVLSGRTAMDESIRTLLESTSVTRWHMGENCRNPRAVAEAALALAGLPAETYSGYLRTGGAANDVTLLPFEGEEQAFARARSAVSEARGRGFRDKDIVLLSFAADERSTAMGLLAQGMRLMPAGNAASEIAYSSVQAFKGMERSVVIVTDTRVDLGELGRNLFYTALTRATGQAYVLCRKKDASTLGNWISGGAA